MRAWPRAVGSCQRSSFASSKLRQRNYSTRPPSESADSGGQVLTRDDLQTNVLTLLHKAGTLLPRGLLEGSTLFAGWKAALDLSHEDMSSQVGVDERKRSVVVIGSKRKCDATVNALLDDGFQLSENERSTLRNRWEAVGPSCEAIIISEPIPSTSSTKSYHLHIRSPLLSRYNAQVTEFRDPSAAPLSTLLSADLIIEVPTTPKPEVVLQSSSKKMLLVDVAEALQLPSDVEVIQADPTRALEGIDELLRNPSSSTAVSLYQHDIHASRMAHVHDAIHRRFTQLDYRSGISDPLEDFESAKFNSARGSLLGITEAVLEEQRVDRGEVARAKEIAKSLRQRIETLPFTWEERILGPGASNVVESLSASEAAMKKVFVNFVWWKLPFKVDDLGNDVSTALHVNWCRSLERQIIYESGLLSATQSSLRESTYTRLASLPKSFQSSLLLNSLEQLSTSTYSIKPTVLAQPLTTRLSQLLQYPTSFLHSSAQKAVLKGSLTTLASAAGGYGLWFEQLLVPETALGVGLLGVVVGMRWTQRTWERARKEWWRNWKRVGEGLEDDLKLTLRDCIQRNVIAVPEFAASSLEGRVRIQTERIDQLELEATQLQEDIRQL